VLLFQVNHYFRTAFLYIRNDEIIQCPFRKKETVTAGSITFADFLSGKDINLSDLPLRLLR
ncbi:hypothetical protein DW982_09715, partial [Phocaeicola plebeius]